MKKLWLAVVAVLVAALWLLTLWSPAPPPADLGELRKPDEPEPEPASAQRPPEVPVAQPAPTPPAAPVGTAELPRMPPPPMQGAVAALKQRYESESRAGSPPAQEQQLAAAVKATDVDLLDSVECRRTVCKVRMAWMPKHGFSGMRLIAELRGKFDATLAIDQAGPASADGTQTVDAYIDITPKLP